MSRIGHVFLATVFFTIAAASPGLAKALNVPAVYRGQIPCADCPGINVTLKLNSDGTYALRYAYVGRATSHAEHGRWRYDAESSLLTLAPSTGTPEYFRGGNQGLRMLDANRNPIEPVSSHLLTRNGKEMAGVSLEGTTWYLVTLGGVTVTAPPERTRPSMTLDAQNSRVSGTGGCNHFNGTYTATASGALTFASTASTRMFCSGEMPTEDHFFKMLTNVRGYHIEGVTLHLIDANGVTLATLAPH